MEFSGKRVLFVHQRNWGQYIGHFIAKKLAAEGARLAAVTYKKENDKFHRTQKEVKYEMLISNDAVIDDPESVLKGRHFSLEHITKELGIQSVWPLIYASREMTRSYNEGILFSSTHQQLTDEQIKAYIQAAFAYVIDLFDQFKPDVVIAPLLAEPSHQMIYFLARQRGIKCLCFTHSKIESFWIASQSPWEDDGPFFERVDELNRGAISKNIERARKYIKDFRESYKRPAYVEKFYQAVPLWKRIRAQLAPYRAIWEWYANRQWNNCVASLGPNVDCRPPRIILRDHYVKLWQSYKARTFSYDDYVPTLKYVYYPLQFEPEIMLDVFAPYFANQVELARLIAKSLPGDYTLLVKDHPQMLGSNARFPRALFADRLFSNTQYTADESERSQSGTYKKCGAGCFAQLNLARGGGIIRGAGDTIRQPGHYAEAP
jgi:hypothetical protein